MGTKKDVDMLEGWRSEKKVGHRHLKEYHSTFTSKMKHVHYASVKLPWSMVRSPEKM